MDKKFAVIAASLAMAATVNLHAATKRFPNGCKPVGFEYQDGMLVLMPVSETDQIQTVYLIHNMSHDTVNFISKKMPNQVFAPKYKHSIRPASWSSFSTNEHKIQFICKQGGYSYGQQINCADVLEICQYPRAKFAPHNGGTYWIKKSESRRQAVRSVIRNGVLLRW